MSARISRCGSMISVTERCVSSLSCSRLLWDWEGREGGEGGREVREGVRGGRGWGEGGGEGREGVRE